MWDTSFDESMLTTNKDIIINCPYKYLVEDLMEILERNGVKWRGQEVPTIENSRWGEYEEDTCYWIESKELSYSDKQYAEEDPDGELEGYLKCVFYGAETPDFETATDAELRSLLGFDGGNQYVRIL